MNKIAIIGDGGWGTALALLLNRKGEEVTIWGAFPDYVEELRQRRYNRKFLPEVYIPPAINFTSELAVAIKGADTVILAVPSQFIRAISEKARPFFRTDQLVISATKGLETGTLKRMSEVMKEILDIPEITVLSGPSHAEEVARSIPTTVVVASESPPLARRAQKLLMEEWFRVYLSQDVTGVELGGALKNCIAIAAGICDGLGFGDNTKSALLTRGIVEISRLGITLGAHPDTFWGLSGIGDLIATSFSPYGRNLKLGRMIGQGMSLVEALDSTNMVVEGVKTAAAAYSLATRRGVEIPITEEIYRVLYEQKSPLQAVRELMTREPKFEIVC